MCLVARRYEKRGEQTQERFRNKRKLILGMKTLSYKKQSGLINKPKVEMEHNTNFRI